MVSPSSQGSQGLEEKMRDELAKNQAAMGLLSLSSVVRDGTFRNRSPTLPTTSTEYPHGWRKTEEENALLKMQLMKKDSLLKDVYGYVLNFCMQHPPLLEHLKDMLPSTGRWSETLRQNLIYRLNALKLELDTPRSSEYDWKKYQEKIKVELEYLGNTIKMITEGPYGYSNNIGTGEGENGIGLGGHMMYEMCNSATISIVGSSPSRPPVSNAVANNEKLFTSAADKRHLEEEQGTAPQIHAIDKSKAKSGFFCLCSMVFRSRDDLSYHIKVQSSPTGVAISCTTCKVCFSSPEELINHRKSVHKISPCPADLEKVCLNQAPVRPSQGFQANSLDNMPSSNCPDFDDPSIQELIQIGGPPSGPLHAVDVTKSHLGAYCICGHRCANRNALQHHTWYRTNVDRIKCDFCPRSYPGYSYLHRHQYSAHRFTPPSFPNTDEVVIVSTKENLERDGNLGTSRSGSSHPRQHNQNQAPGGIEARANKGVHGVNTSKQRNGLFSCLCKEKFRTLPSLKKHVKMYSRDPVLPCKVCGNKFYTVKYLKRHMSKKHKVSSNGYMKGCYDCGLVFEESWKYLEHLKYVHKSGPLFGINKIRAANKRQLAKPEQAEHGLCKIVEVVDLDLESPIDNSDTSDENSDSGSASSSPSTCYCKCGKSFPTLSALEDHARVSAARLVFSCEWCSKRFSSHAGLKSHISRSHKEIKYDNKYGCNKCGRTFKTRQQLMTHIQHFHPQPRLFPFQEAAEA